MEIGVWIHRISNSLNRIIRIVLFIMTLSFSALIFTGVVFRYIIKHPLIFSVEIAKLLFIWSAFLALTVAYKEKKHIRFQFLNAILKKRGLALNEVIIRISGAVFFAVLLFYAIRFTQTVWPTFFPVLNLSQGWLYVSVILSLVILIVHSIDLSLEALKELKAAYSDGKMERKENT